MECRYDSYQGYLYTSFSCVWALYTIWWLYNTWFLNKQFTKPLQKLIIYALLFKSLYSCFYGCSRLFCTTSEDEAYWGLGITSSFTLFNTFIYTVFSLISSGFCVLRDSLSRSEVTSIAVIMGFVYLGFSAYLIEPESVAPFLLVILGSLFFSATKSSIKNIKLLQRRFYVLQQANIRPILPEISEKVSMMKRFLWLSYVFYVNEVAKFALLCVGKTARVEETSVFWQALSAVEQTLVSVSCFSIFWIFRSKDRRREFNSSLIFDFEPHEIPPMLVARINQNVIIEGETTAIVVCPQILQYGNQNLGNSLKLMVAVPIK